MSNACSNLGAVELVLGSKLLSWPEAIDFLSWELYQLNLRMWQSKGLTNYVMYKWTPESVMC
jgi:hypothetical protein